MASQGYWLVEFISISSILRKAPSRYARAFLYTETDDNDTTYFVLNQLRVLHRGIRRLHQYLEKNVTELRETEAFLRRSALVRAVLNHRQIALLNHAMKHGGFVYTIQSHQRSHVVAYETARSDLQALADLTLLEQTKEGRRFVYVAPYDLQERVDRLRPSRRSARRS